MFVAAFLTVIVAQATVVVYCGHNPKPIPETPVFADNYTATGFLYLPYAELKEPFNAWYDKKSARSRTDFYGNLYKIYQYGHSEKRFGTMLKLIYVPRDTFQNSTLKEQGPTERTLEETYHGEGPRPSRVKRVCINIGFGEAVKAQSVLPNLANFVFDSVGNCPQTNSKNWQRKCELWKMVTNNGDKRNTYSMWIYRNRRTNAPMPLLYQMIGYDTLLGSHYDHYEISYTSFRPNVVTDDDFDFATPFDNCHDLKAPGNDASSGERRSHIITNNPIHEFVEEPHNHDHIDHEFGKFMKDHGAVYDDWEHQRSSWNNFLHNFRFINSKNRELKDFKLKINKYADVNMNELSYLRGRYRPTGYNGGLDYAKHHNLKGSDGKLRENIPDNWDWNIRGGVNPVKDQAVCGSCWSFGTVGTIEGAYFAKTGKLAKLSEQQLVDCSWPNGNNGCDGGEDSRVYQYIIKVGGIALEEDYGKYIGIDGVCHDNTVKKAVKISGFYNVTRNNPEELKHAIVNYGPVTVAIDASRPTFTFYSHGVYYDEECSSDPDKLNHQVLVTGFTEIDGKPVWIVKNSWSAYWGNNGYIMMSAEKNNCGILDIPTVPIIES